MNQLRVVNDQISSPTWARMLAEISARVLSGGGDDIHFALEDRTGLYHVAGEGYASRYEWAKMILSLDPSAHEQVTRDLVPVSSEEFPTPATRPLFSALDCTKFQNTFGLQLPSWERSLELAMHG